MYPDAMFNFATVADKLNLTINEVLDILDMTPYDAEQENLSVNEIIEAVEDSVDYQFDDWRTGCDFYSYN